MNTNRIGAAALIAIASACGAIAAFGGCNGTGGGDTGDKIPHAHPDVLGNGQRVTEIVAPATWYDATNTNSVSCNLPLDVSINMTGQVIVAVDRYDETGTGQVGNIYIQDVPVEGAGPVPYSGLEVFGAAFTPPDLRVFEGDVVDTLGTFDEFPGPSGAGKGFSYCETLPEASGTMTFRSENGFHPAAEVVAGGADPARWGPVTGYANGRQWLGMLVKFSDVTLAQPISTGGRYRIGIVMPTGTQQGDIIYIDNELFDLKNAGLALTPGTTIKSVTGILTYFYTFSIAPRSAADIEL